MWRLRSSSRVKLRPTSAVAFSAATSLAHVPSPELHLLRSRTSDAPHLSAATLRHLLQSLRIDDHHFADALFLLADVRQTGRVNVHHLLILYSLFRQVAFASADELSVALQNVVYFVFAAAAGSDAATLLSWPQWLRFASNIGHQVGGPDSLPCEDTLAQLRSAWPGLGTRATCIAYPKFVCMLRNCDGGLLLNLRAMAFLCVSAVVHAAHAAVQMPAWNEPVDDSRFLSQFVTHAISTRVGECQGASGTQSSASSLISESMPRPPLVSGGQTQEIRSGPALQVPAASSCPDGDTEHQPGLPLKYFGERQGSSSIRQKPFSFPQSRSSLLAPKALTSFSATVSRSSRTRGKTPFHIDFSSLKLGEKLGSGAYGEVFEGSFLMTPVAVKVFHINIQNDAAESNNPSPALSRMSTMRKLQRFASIRSQNKYRDFIREVEMMSLVRHPNLVLYMGACGDPFTPLCIVSELFAGGSLYDFLHNDPDSCLDAYVAVTIALSIARGMFYLHSSKPSILHRDLKSNNVLLSDRKGADGVPHVVICDFGQSQLFGHEGEYELGTASYMSPNVVNREKYEERDDTYSFGILLHEIFTGAVPFEGMSSVQIMYQVVNNGLRPTSDRDAGIPQEIRRLIDECWDEDKSKRPLFDSIIAALESFEGLMKTRNEESIQQCKRNLQAGVERIQQLDDSEFLKKTSLAASSVSSKKAVSPN